MPSPFPDCGPDPKEDRLRCRSFDRCAGTLAEITFFGETFELNGAFWALDRSPPHDQNGDLDEFKEELVDVLRHLPSDFQFSVGFFDAGLLRFPPASSEETPATAGPETVEQAVDFVESVGSGSGTCPDLALLSALLSAGSSTATRKAIFFASDGSGTCGGMSATSYREYVLDIVAAENTQAIPIHVFGFSVAYPVHESFLRELATRTGGTYRRVSP